MPTLTRATDLPCDVPTALATSLDLELELVAGRRLHALVPVRHTSEITEVVAGPGGRARFVDVMVSGAFAEFRHEHRFEPLPPGPDGAPRTRMHDAMTWRSPLGVLGRLADAVLVRRTLTGLLTDRNREIARRVERSRSS